MLGKGKVVCFRHTSCTCTLVVSDFEVIEEKTLTVLYMARHGASVDAKNETVMNNRMTVFCKLHFYSDCNVLAQLSVQCHQR